MNATHSKETPIGGCLDRLVGARPHFVTNWSDSCDFCKYQEGRHYCLLHGKPMKNMDVKRCDEWTQRPNDQAEQ